MLEEGVWAEIKVPDRSTLRLFSEHNAQGVQASVYDVNGKKWIAPSEPVDDIEEGKEKAAEHARAYLRNANLSTPLCFIEYSPVSVRFGDYTGISNQFVRPVF